jgi:hypothetical protein
MTWEGLATGAQISSNWALTITLNPAMSNFTFTIFVDASNQEAGVMLERDPVRRLNLVEAEVALV